MKQKLLFLLAALAFLQPARLSAFYYKYEGITLNYTVLDEEAKTCEVSSNRNFSGALVIPDVANDGTTEYSVTKIGYHAFEDCSGLTSVVICNSVQTIGMSAFDGCSGLTSVVIGNSVEEIGSHAFAFCKGLTSVVIPNSVKTIGMRAFEYCRGLTSVVIGNSVEEIGSYAFAYCSGLISVEIGNSVQTIGSSAFEDCSDMISLVIPDSVKEIDFSAFKGCSNLTSVVIGNSVEEIGSNSFANCSGLTSVVIGNSVQTIGMSAFNGCSGLTSVVIGNSVEEIGSFAFYSCHGLTYLEINAENCRNIGSFSGPAFPNSIETLIIGDKVANIPQYSFLNCEKLTSVVIPNSVQTIGYAAFDGCSLDTIIMGHGIKSIDSAAFRGCPASNIFITAQTPPEIKPVTFANYKGMLYLQGQAAVNAYYNDRYWGNFNSELMTEPTVLKIEGMTSISGNAGDTFQLEAKMTPDYVSLPYIFWRSTKPKIATVDKNGLVMLKEYSISESTRSGEDEDNDSTCRIIAESLYFNGPVAEIIINNTGINGVKAVIDRNDNLIDYRKPYEVYNMNGLKVGETTEGLAKGIYIIRQGKAAVKTIMKNIED